MSGIRAGVRKKEGSGDARSLESEARRAARRVGLEAVKMARGKGREAESTFALVDAETYELTTGARQYMTAREIIAFCRLN